MSCLKENRAGFIVAWLPHLDDRTVPLDLIHVAPFHPDGLGRVRRPRRIPTATVVVIGRRMSNMVSTAEMRTTTDMAAMSTTHLPRRRTATATTVSAAARPRKARRSHRKSGHESHEEFLVVRFLTFSFRLAYTFLGEK